MTTEDELPDGWARIAPPDRMRSETLVRLDDGRVLRIVETPDGSDVASRIWDPATDVWSVTGPQRTKARDRSAVVTAEGWVHASGGVRESVAHGPTAACDLYVPAKDAWFEMPPLPAPSYLHAVVCVHGRVMAIGGKTTEPRLATGVVDHASVATWAPGEQAWSEAPPLPMRIPGVRAVVLADESVVAWGGAETAVRWDGTRWESIGAIDERAAVLAMPHGLLVLGGSNAEYASDRVMAWTLERGWEARARLPKPRKRPHVVRLVDGRIAVFGGTRTIRRGTFAELPADGAFVQDGARWREFAAPRMRGSHVFALADGRVLMRDLSDAVIWSDG